MRRIILALMTVLATVLMWPAQAEAATVRSVYVVNRLPATYPVKHVLPEWHKAARVNMYFTSTCSGKSHCITIKEGELGTTRAGVASTSYSYNPSSPSVWLTSRTTITIDYSMRTKSFYAKKWVVCHEVGHALRVGHTNRQCMKTGPAYFPLNATNAVPGAYNLSLAK